MRFLKSTGVGILWYPQTFHMNFVNIKKFVLGSSPDFRFIFNNKGKVKAKNKPSETSESWILVVDYVCWF